MLSFAADGVDRMSFNEEMTLCFPPGVRTAGKAIFAQRIKMMKEKYGDKVDVAFGDGKGGDGGPGKRAGEEEDGEGGGGGRKKRMKL